MIERKAGFWLDTYMKYTFQSEAPDSYHIWSAISIIAACLQRKVWLDWGFFDIFPNLYIILVGPPGARKNIAINIAVSLTRGVKGVMFASDCTTGPALVEAIKECEAVTEFENGKKVKHSSITIVSKEFINFIHVDDHMMTWLTDLFDTHEEWKYRTKGRGTYPIEGVWVNLLGGITPTGFTKVVPDEVIGEGFPSRVVFVVEEGPRKLTAKPKMTAAEIELRNALTHDLRIISLIKGEFHLDEEADAWFVQWYEHPKPNVFRDDKRFSGYFARKHIHLLKTAMVVSACISSNKIITKLHLEHALDLLNGTEGSMIEAFSSTGRSLLNTDIDDVRKLLKKYRRLSKDQLLGQIWRDVNPMHFEYVFGVLKDMKLISEEIKDGKIWYKWIKEDEDGS